MRIQRKGHAFEGRELRVYSCCKRGRQLCLLLVLPDESRSLIPASWTDWRARVLGQMAGGDDAAPTSLVLNRQERTTAYGLRFTQNLVGNLRRSWGIPRFEPPEHPAAGELMSIQQAAKALDIAASTLHRWINDGFIAGEQVTPGAPWRIRVTDALRGRLVEDAPSGYVAMVEATKRLGVTRQTVLQRVKRGELDAVLVCYGRRKGLRIKVLDEQPGLFEPTS